MGRIAAHKSFLNLTQQRATLGEHPAKTEKGLWAVTGMVAEFSGLQCRPEVQAIEANVQARAFFSLIRETHDRHGYDYLDASVMPALPSVPSTFGGVSGGGLWEVSLSMTRSGHIAWDGKRHFRGVAFWESPVADGRRVIRCHGPRSTLETAWKAWALPEGA